MRKPVYDISWPLPWKECYRYDLIEFFGNTNEPGYSYAYLNRFNSIINYVETYLPKGSNILDIAAAQGNFSLTLAELGYNVIWNDLRDNLINYVKKKYESGNIEYFPGNAFDIALKTKFDGVIITEIIEHVAHPDKFLKKVASLIKPGGYIFMSTPLGNYFLNDLPRFSDCKNPAIFESVQFKPNNDGHIFLLYEDEIHLLGKNSGLTIKEKKVYNNPLTSGHIKTKILLKIFPKKLIDLIENLTQKLPAKVRLKLHSNIAIVFSNN